LIEPQAHLQRIAAYCAAISAPLGVDPGLLAPAAWLHDVGMVAINTSTAAGIRAGWWGRRSRSRAGSWRSPTPSTRS